MHATDRIFPRASALRFDCHELAGAFGLPYGYVAGLLTGTTLYYLTRDGRLRLGHG